MIKHKKLEILPHFSRKNNLKFKTKNNIIGIIVIF